MTHSNAQGENESVWCGFIKAKFPLQGDKELGQHASYMWANDHARPRVTQHYIYIALGHTDIPDNETARSLIGNIEMLGGKITRLDFFVDYLGKLDYDAFYDLHDNDVRPQPSIVKSPSGKTVYVGKRSSARMLRVYDKRAEILVKHKTDIGFNITRIELEVKRDMINRYKTLFMSGRCDVILSDIQEIYKLRNFCERHAKSRPTDVRDKTTTVFVFIHRFRHIIKRAILTDSGQFLDTVGVNKDDIT